MANQAPGSTNQRSFVNQGSFVMAITKYILTANNPISVLNDFDKEKRIFLNYWKAIAGILDDDRNPSSVLYRYNGVELFCQFSIPFFMKLQESRNFTVNTMKNLLRDCFENIEGEYAGVGHAQWWGKGGKASGLNAVAVRIVAREMNKALHKPSMSSEIELRRFNIFNPPLTTERIFAVIGSGSFLKGLGAMYLQRFRRTFFMWGLRRTLDVGSGII